MEIVSTDPVKLTVTYDIYRREVFLEVGKKYVIEQLNPRIMKNRGRIVEILGFSDNFMPQFAIVKYLDTKRTGKVDVSDLAPYKD